MRAHYLVAGLLGLAGLACAAPTPVSTVVQLGEVTSLDFDAPDTLPTPETDSITPAFQGIPELVTENNHCYPPDKKHFLSICDGVDSLHTHILPKESFNKCVALNKFVAYHVISFILSPGLTCKFYEDSNGCHGEPVYVAKTTGSRASQFGVKGKYGKRMKYVFCHVGGHDTVMKGVEGRADDPPPTNQSPPDNAPPEHGPPVLEAKAAQQANEDDALSIRDTDVIHVAEETPQLSSQ